MQAYYPLKKTSCEAKAKKTFVRTFGPISPTAPFPPGSPASPFEKYYTTKKESLQCCLHTVFLSSGRLTVRPRPPSIPRGPSTPGLPYK